MADAATSNPAPTQSTPTPKPTNGATTQTQQPAQPAEHPELLEAKKLKAEAESARAATEKARRVYAAEQRKFADEKKGIGAKLSEYEQLKKWKADQERVEQQAKLNKSAFLKAKFGEDWYEQIMAEKTNGGAPTADTVALEVARVREEMEQRFEAYKAEQEKASKEAQTRHVQAELKAFTDSARDFAKANVKDYPIFERLGGEQQVAQAIVSRIRAEHDRTSGRDEDGNHVPGKVLTFKEAADALESDMIAIAESAHDKYKTRLTEKFKPATVAPAVNGGPQLRRTEVPRRTLSNDLGASTPGRQPPKSDDERRQRAIDAYNAARKAPTP